MDDEPHVGLVDAHAEGVGGHDDLEPAFHKRLLGPASLVGQQAGVIDAGAALGLPGHRLGDLFGPFAGRGVDDSRPGRLPEELQQHVGLLALGPRALDLVEEVRPREAGDEGPRLAEVELLNDVAADLVGGGGRQGDGRRPAQRAAEVSQPAVVGPEVVSPLADAMGLVDRQQLDPALP